MGSGTFRDIETGIFTHGVYTRSKPTARKPKRSTTPNSSWRNQMRGRVFAIACEGPNAIPKLIRYETALSNRFLKCVDRFLRFLQSGADQPGEDESLAPYNDSSEIAQVFTPLPPNYETNPIPT